MPQFMTLPRITASVLALAAASCSPAPKPEPTPPVVTVEVPRPTPSPTPLSQPEYENFLDAPQTPGDWTYSASQGQTIATFAQGGQPAKFVIACRRSEGKIGLARPGDASGQVPMRFRTETAERMILATPRNGLLVAEFQPNDPLLDAIAFSRGRFAVETAGLPTLYIPAWPEITRVIEDCR